MYKTGGHGLEKPATKLDVKEGEILVFYHLSEIWFDQGGV